MSSDDELIFYYCLLAKRKMLKKKTKRSKWCKKYLLKRDVSSHTELIEDLREDPNEWRNYMRMDESAYTELLNLVTPYLQKQDTIMRKAISPHERLSATLRFLATGRSYRDLRFSCRISVQSLSVLIPETCQAIYTVLKEEYMKIPQTPEEWKKIAEEFEEKWNFPHCLGAIDGKHVRILPPSGSGSYFYNYKGFHSMVLMAVVNANYEFLISEFGVNGRISDGGVLEVTTFHKKLRENSLGTPNPEKLKDSFRTLNYAFVGDEAFALSPNLIKPFSQKELTNEKRIYNYRLSRARRVVENAFGILAARFRIFHTSINMKIEYVRSVVMAACALHTFLRRTYSANYTTSGSLDYEDTIEGTLSQGLRTSDSDLVDLQRGRYKAISNNAKMVREEFLNYFNNEGSVPWQKKVCNIINN